MATTLGNGDITFPDGTVKSSRALTRLTPDATFYRYTGVPSYATRIVMSITNMAFSGTDDIIIRLIDSTGQELTSGYVSTSDVYSTASSSAGTSATAYWHIRRNSSTDVFSGIVTIDWYSNLYCTFTASGRTATNKVVVSGGDISSGIPTISGVYVGISGTNTFTSGVVVAYAE